MIKNLYGRIREKFSSLYLRLLLVIIFGMIVSVGVFVVLRLLSNSYISTNYMLDENKKQREAEYIENFQQYISDNGLTSEDMREISAWAKSNRYVYLLLYKDDKLFFTSDMIIPDEPNDDETAGNGGTQGGSENGENGDTGATEGSQNGENQEGDGDGQGVGGEVGSGGSGSTDGDGEESSQGGSHGGTQSGSQGGTQGGSGIIVDYPTREELYEHAAANDQYVIELSDGMLLASVADFSEYFYYDLNNIISLALAMLVLGFIILNYFRQIIVRIKRLEADVTIVTHRNMNHKIHYRGYDEISRLSGNVENMRNSILKNLEGERTARAANTELITAMSHDIRTPLTVLLGYLDIMKGEAKDEGVMGEYIRAAENTALRLKSLSDDMFKYALVFGDSDERPELEDYDALMLLEQMLSEHILLLGESGYTVDVGDMPEDIPEGATVRTNAQSLMRIIDNIFSNLRKYADANDPIKIKFARDAECLILTISNKRRGDIDNVESNGIGLKTCVRLAGLIGCGFKYGYKGKSFVSELSINVAERIEIISEEERTEKALALEEKEKAEEATPENDAAKAILLNTDEHKSPAAETEKEAQSHLLAKSENAEASALVTEYGESVSDEKGEEQNS